MSKHMRILLGALVTALLLLAACGGDGRDESAFLDSVRSGPAPSAAVAGNAELIAVGDAICDGDGWANAVPGEWLTSQAVGDQVRRDIFLLDLVIAAEEHLC